MKLSALQTHLADQLYTWTDNHAFQAAQTDFCCSAQTPMSATAADTTARSTPSRLPHRALQTLWQAGLQMRSRPWSWPQVLPLGQSLRATAANGLHSPGLSPPGHRISGQLSATPSDFGRDLRHQSRAVITSRGALRNRYEPCPSLSLGFLRCRTWQSALQLLRQFVQPALFSVRLDVLERLIVHSCRSAIGFAARVGECQNVLAVHLVVQGVKAEAGRFLRFVVQRRLQFLNACWGC